MLSRSAHRAREIAIRMALGATRWRVIRQLLLESVVLAIIGGSIGLLLAVAGVRMFEAAMQDSGKPFWLVFTVDYVVIAYAAAICLVTAILSGLAPALHVSKTNQNDVLKEGGRGTAGSVRARWFSGTMVVAELALTVVLLAGAGLMIRSFLKVSSIDPGIDIDRLITMRTQLPNEIRQPEARRAFFERLELDLGAIPGVESAAVTTGVPPLDGGERLLEIEGAQKPDEPLRFVSTVTISPRFFEVVGVSLIRGRNFRDVDGAPGSETVIINERLSTQFFRGDNPIGRRLRFTERKPVPGKAADVWRTIVGISGRVLHGIPRGWLPERSRLHPVPPGVGGLARHRFPFGEAEPPSDRIVASEELCRQPLVDDDRLGACAVHIAKVPERMSDTPTTAELENRHGRHEPQGFVWFLSPFDLQQSFSAVETRQKMVHRGRLDARNGSQVQAGAAQKHGRRSSGLAYFDSAVGARYRNRTNRCQSQDAIGGTLRKLRNHQRPHNNRERQFGDDRVAVTLKPPPRAYAPGGASPAFLQDVVLIRLRHVQGRREPGWRSTRRRSPPRTRITT